MKEGKKAGEKCRERRFLLDGQSWLHDGFLGFMLCSFVWRGFVLGVYGVAKQWDSEKMGGEKNAGKLFESARWAL
ncbi:hypothetical protein GOBAR_AA35021 [Gossypium barbadense]|uniref:Uncharacterized protein n=1 Tax=Gossypium barbadense TaxID=3634 RepID=A0A2P5W3N1_GOSBA|nr:hypothetical protein GOBAR_AA35021 [Gossypium barbadense]